MKKSLVILLCVVACMSCKKDIMLAPIPTVTSTVLPNHSPIVIKIDTPITKKPVKAILTIGNDPNNIDHVVQAGNTYSLANVPFGIIDATLQGSSATLQTLPVTLITSNGGTGSANANSFVTTLRLYNSAGIQLDSEIIPAGASPVVVFRNLNFSMAAGSTSILTVKGDIAPIDGTIVNQPLMVQVSVTPANVSTIQAYDANNNLFSSTNLSGSMGGPKVYFTTSGIAVSANGSPTAVYSNPGGSQVHGICTMTIPFSVTAYGVTSYVPSLANLVTSGTVGSPVITTGPYIQYVVDNGTSLLSGATATITYTGSNNLSTDQNGNYQVPVGQTDNFNLTVTYSPTTPGSYRVRVVNVNSTTTSASGALYSPYVFGFTIGKFCTPYITGQ